MPYADNNGVRIHYQVEGNGSPLVLQHGSTSSIQAWYQNGYVEPLKADYQLVLVDARGHGQSDKPHDSASYALPLRVSDIVAVLDDLGIETAHYYGYSMGGWIGFAMAKHAADRLRTLIIGGAHPYAESAEAFHGVDGTDPDAFIAAMEKFAGQKAPPEARERILGCDIQALAAAMHDRDSLEDIVPTMTMPCFLFVGEADPRFSKVQQFFTPVLIVTMAP
jgi:pimeloyl-ACP methyl ester carboxylesterase